jgi:hypothetical protein
MNGLHNWLQLDFSWRPSFINFNLIARRIHTTTSRNVTSNMWTNNVGSDYLGKVAERHLTPLGCHTHG